MLTASSYGAIDSTQYEESIEILSPKSETTEASMSKGYFSISKLILSTSAVIIVVMLAFAGMSTKYSTFSSVVAPNLKVNGDNVVTFTLYRDGYSPILDFAKSEATALNYAFLDDYIGVIEPYVSNYLMIKSGSSESASYYTYTATSSDSSTTYSASYYPSDSSKTTALTIGCSAFDAYTLTVYEFSADDLLLSTSTGSFVCMYVRREFRSLTDTDLSDFMDAMATLWDVGTEEGVALYGDSYISGEDLLNLHYFQSSWPDSDHSHEGKGFVSSHVVMTNMLETSLQLVDSAVTVPYWDFTIEKATGVEVYDSPMFQATSFGSITAKSSWNYSTSNILEGKISDGRFADLTISNNSKYLEFRNGYGLMRSPWESNPSPYITRYTSTTTSLPACSDHYDSLNKNRLVDFLGFIQVSPHANTHMITAGRFGCELMDQFEDAGYLTSASSACSHFTLKQKFWYRYKYLELYDDCYVIDEDYSNPDNFVCGYTCYETDSGIETFYALFDDYYSDNITTTGKEAIRQFFCGGDGHKIIVGDMFVSSSAGDPSFWPIHGTLERLYHVKMLVGGFTDDTYAYEYPTEMSDVCTFYECYEYSTGEYGNYSSCCDGHYEDDKLFNYADNDRTTYIGPSNIETLKSTDASSSSYSMNYVYDSFSWAHCSDNSSSDIDALLAEYITVNYGVELPKM